MLPQAHLQSFPFAMNPTPQLSDLINPQHFSPVSQQQQNYQSNGSVAAAEDGSPSSMHQISPIGGGPNLANGGFGNAYGTGGGIASAQSLAAVNLAAATGGAGSPPSPVAIGRHPFDSQSALASPGRNGISLAGLNGVEVNGVKKRQPQHGAGATDDGGAEISTIWSTAELPEIDLMIELSVATSPPLPLGSSRTS